MGYMDNNGLLYFWTKLKTIFIRKINNVGPDSNGNVSLAIPDPATANPVMNGTAAVGTATKYAREDHVHPTDTTRASSTHTHGNITNAGALQTNDVTIANGDKLVITDASDSNKVARASISFDGSTESKALTPKGTWKDFPVKMVELSLSNPNTTYDSGGYVIQSTGTLSFTDISSYLYNEILVVLHFLNQNGDRFYLLPVGQDTLNTRILFSSPITDAGPLGPDGLFYTLELNQANNAFTLKKGILKAETQASTDNSTKVATTAFVKSLITASDKYEVISIATSGGNDGHYTGDISENWSAVYNRIVAGKLVVLEWSISSSERWLFYPTESTVATSQNGTKELTFATVPFMNGGTAGNIFQYVLVGDYTSTSFAIDENAVFQCSPYTSNPEMDGTASPGDVAQYARGNHVHPKDTSKANLASPTFTGTPKAPTAAAGTNTTQIATTAFVQAAIASAVSGVASFKGAATAQSTIDGTANIQTGWYWVVQTAGTYYGQDCESGDFIYVTASSPIRNPQDNTKWADSNFSIIQTNITPMTNAEIDTIVAS